MHLPSITLTHEGLSVISCFHQLICMRIFKYYTRKFVGNGEILFLFFAFFELMDGNTFFCSKQCLYLFNQLMYLYPRFLGVMGS